jgi:Asp-tRNA(Asn)/Glu-tRNA(Gln) amidotransferase A subunit family amidase
MPLGVQFVSALNEDSLLLTLGTKFESIFAAHPSV